MIHLKEFTNVYDRENFLSGSTDIKYPLAYTDIVSKHVDFIRNEASNYYRIAPEKIKDYLFSVQYDGYDWKRANKYFHETLLPHFGMCSSVRKGNWYGRNYDWYYDHEAEFVIRVPNNGKRYSSIGMARCLPEATDQMVSEGKYLEAYDYLPFHTVDAINEYGVVANLNVTVTGDTATTTGTHPGAREDLCVFELVRYIVDNFKTAEEAVMHIRDHVNVYAPHNPAVFDDELHVMVADSGKTFLIEFLDNVCHVTDMTEGSGTNLAGKPYMTNFYLTNAGFYADGHIDLSTTTDYGAGMERYNIIADAYAGLSTKDDMLTLMTERIKYTNAYDASMNPFWKSELASREFGLKASDPIERFQPYIDIMLEWFRDRSRDKGSHATTGATWQTVHTSVYDIANRRLNLVVQEQGKASVMEFGLN